MKHATFDDIVEVVEHGVAESAPWHKQFRYLAETRITSLMVLLVRGIMTSPVALMRLPVSLPFNLPAERGSLAIRMIMMSGKVRRFIRMNRKNPIIWLPGCASSRSR